MVTTLYSCLEFMSQINILNVFLCAWLSGTLIGASFESVVEGVIPNPRQMRSKGST